MSNKIITQNSKFLSLVLRHKPETIGLQLDELGWADVEELIAKVNASGKKGFDLPLLKRIVEENNKKRFAFNEDETKIRASQGHSISVDLGLEAIEPPEILYHGTATRFVESIEKSGLTKQNRHLVHLSQELETALSVGGRHGKPVILKVKALKMHQEGHAFYRSENGVWLTDHVPVSRIEFP